MKILLAIDDSKFSETATQTVSQEFPPQNTQVRVLHVVEPMYISIPPQMSAGYAPELEEMRKDLLKRGRELVATAADKLRAAGFKVDTAVEEGNIRTTIIDQAEDLHADLIVIGSHGRSGLNRFLLGSVSEFVARHAPCSVQIVRPLAGATVGKARN